MYKVYYQPNEADIFYPHRRYDDTISVIEIGMMTPWRNYDAEITHGDIYLLQFVICGKGKFCDQNFVGPCFFVVEPNDLLKYSVDGDSDLFEEYWMKLSGKACKQFLEEAGFPTRSGLYPLNYARQAQKVFKELMKESNYADADDRYFMLKGFLQLCELQRQSISSSRTSESSNSYTIRAIEYIHQHYSEQISEEMLADYLHISKSYMHKLFCNDMGMTPNFYINKYRVQLAKKLLLETSYSIAQIAESIGYSNGDYFCRVFQKFAYRSPTQYRKDGKMEKRSILTTNIIGTEKLKNDWIWRDEATQIMVREVDITTQRAIRPLRIGIIADPHFNSYDSEDISSSNPTLLNTIKTRKWLENGQSVPQTDACLDFISDCDQLIVLGDILDYLSHGAMELAKKHIFEKYPNIIACVGNHDATQRIGGSIKETSPLEERIRLLQSIWPHDIAYHSRMLGDSVMLIQMDNGTTGFFTQSQVDSLKKDIDTARENGYTVLIFLHKPLSINNPTVTSTFPIRRNQGGLANFNTPGLIGYHSLGASAEGYNIIANSADIIKGIFCADLHSDYYMKICAKTPDGGDAFIRQYVLTGTPFDQGHVMIVNIK